MNSDSHLTIDHELCSDHGGEHPTIWDLPHVPLGLKREWLELETAEICKELNITATNAWVLLHRARLRLQMCLQERWFGQLPEARKAVAR